MEVIPFIKKNKILLIIASWFILVLIAWVVNGLLPSNEASGIKPPSSYTSPSVSVYLAPTKASNSSLKTGSSSSNTSTSISGNSYNQNRVKYARIVYDGQVNLRRTPGYMNKNDAVDVMTTLLPGTEMRVVGGPEYIDGINWWNVKWNGYQGWMADHRGNGELLLEFFWE